MKPIRVLVADDETLVRHSLRISLEGDLCTVVIGEATDDSLTVTAARHAQERDQMLRPAGSEPLTKRELSIVQLLARGMSNAEIAESLHLSQATVKANFGRIMNKWAVRDRVQVLIQAARTGVVTL